MAFPADKSESGAVALEHDEDSIEDAVLLDRRGSVGDRSDR